jgi:hypothetical protein
MYDGRGVAGATIIFHPTDDVAQEAQKFRPYAYTDADGRFVLKTYTDDDGAPTGTYRVSVAAIPASAHAGGQPQRNEGDMAGQAGGAGVDIPVAVRRKYSDVNTAGISVTIADGVNELEPIVMN